MTMFPDPGAMTDAQVHEWLADGQTTGRLERMVFALERLGRVRLALEVEFWVAEAHCHERLVVFQAWLRAFPDWETMKPDDLLSAFGRHLHKLGMVP